MIPNVALYRDTQLSEKKTTIAHADLGKSLMYGCFLLVPMAACSTYTGQPTHTVPSSPVTQPSSVAGPSPTAYSVNVFHPGRVGYHLTITSLVESVSSDSVARRDSMHLTSFISATFTTSATQKTIDASLQVDSSQLVLAANQIRRFGMTEYSYTIDPGSGQVRRIGTLARPVCGMEETNPVTGEEILPRLPTVAMWPRAWNDSTQLELCRAGILFQGVRTATYQWNSTADSTKPIQIIRWTYLTLSGRGSQWMQPVEGTGSGASVDTFLVSRVQSRVVQLSGQAQLEVKFTSRFQNQVLRQVSHLKLALRQ